MKMEIYLIQLYKNYPAIEQVENIRLINQQAQILYQIILDQLQIYQLERVKSQCSCFTLLQVIERTKKLISVKWISRLLIMVV
jgi:hypothetical protein